MYLCEHLNIVSFHYRKYFHLFGMDACARWLDRPRIHIGWGEREANEWRRKRVEYFIWLEFMQNLNKKYLLYKNNVKL